MKTIKFFACTHCGSVADLCSDELEYVQSKEHNYFWNAPANCTGRLTVESTKEAWEAQKGRFYDMERMVAHINAPTA